MRRETRDPEHAACPRCGAVELDVRTGLALHGGNAAAVSCPACGWEGPFSELVPEWRHPPGGAA